LSQEDPDSIESIGIAIGKKYLATGFPTEVQVALTLAEDKWSVTRNARYQVKNDNRYHEIDVIATKRLKPGSITRIALVIECKKQEKYPWIFVADSTEIRNPLAVTVAAKEEAYDEIYSFIESNFKSHYYYGSQASTIHISPYYIFGTKKEQKTDPIKDAIYQILNHWFEIFSLEMETAEKAEPSLTYIYPVIVLNGRLVTYSIQGQAKEANHVPYLIEYLPKEPLPIGGKLHSKKPVVIDVVTLGYFEDYLRLVQTRTFH
jgi:hypothetical protein